MRVISRFCFVALAVSLMLAGCSRPAPKPQAVAPETKPEGARLSTAEVIRIAKQEAERQGADLGRYKEPEAHYELTRKDKTWFVSFDGRVAMPGNHISVRVDDRTGETRFFRGE